MASYKAIFNAVSNKYISVHSVDLETGAYEAFKSHPAIDALCEGKNEAQEALYNVFWHMTNGTSWSTIKNFINLSTIKERLKDNNFVSCPFHSNVNGWCEATFVPVREKSGGEIHRVVFMVSDINERIHKEMSMEEQTRKANALARRTAVQVIMDPLTGLLNLRGTENSIKDFLKTNPAVNCVLMSLDVDDFKLINDVFGHGVGDEVLRKVADTLKRCCPRPCIIGRNGGDEFTVFFTHTSLEEIRPFFKSFVGQKVGFEHGGQLHHVSMSIGAAEYPIHTRDYKQLREYADAALYAVKMSNKNGYQCYYDGMEERNRAQLGFKMGDIVTGLPGAILVYRVRSNGHIIFANDDVIKLVGCDNMQDFMDFTHEKLYSIIHPQDLSRVRRTVFQQYRRQLQEKQVNDRVEGFVKCRLINKQGKEINVECTGRLVYNKFHGEIVYVFIQETSTLDKLLRMTS